MGDGKSLEKLDTMLRQNLWGVKVYYGNVKVGNKQIWVHFYNLFISYCFWLLSE